MQRAGCSFALVPGAIKKAVDIDRGDSRAASSRSPVSIDGQAQAQGVEGPQQEADLGARLSLLDLNEPFATGTHALCQLALVEAEAPPVVADGKTNVDGRSEQDGMIPLGYIPNGTEWLQVNMSPIGVIK
jgi:hypothetical protein